MLPCNKHLLCRNRYDVLDRLGSVDLAEQASLLCFYSGKRRVTEVADNRQRSLLLHDDRLLAQHRGQTGSGETALLLTDRQQSILGVAATTSGSAYLPFGFHAPMSQVAGLPGFNGEPCEPTTGHYLLGNGYRAYLPQLMRFNSPDSWSPFGQGGLNTYGYCLGDPVNTRDPSGHFPNPWKALKRLFGSGKPLRRAATRVDNPPVATPISTATGTAVPPPYSRFARPAPPPYTAEGANVAIPPVANGMPPAYTPFVLPPSYPHGQRFMASGYTPDPLVRKLDDALSVTDPYIHDPRIDEALHAASLVERDPWAWSLSPSSVRR